MKAVSLSTRGQLYNPHAASYERLRIEVALNYGWSLEPTNAAYTTLRPPAAQTAIFKQNYTRTPTGNEYRLWNGKKWYRKQGAPITAVPGTSPHGRGDTVDFGNLGGFNGTRFKQLSRVAGFHGWSNAEGRSVNEPWHWTHNAKSDQSAQARGWYHVNRPGQKLTQTYDSKGRKLRLRPWRFNVYLSGTIRWNGRLWGVTNYGNLYLMSNLTKGKAPKFKAGWFHTTRTTTNGWDKALKKVLHKRKPGFNVYAASVEVRGSTTYLVTRYGTRYPAHELVKGKSKSEDPGWYTVSGLTGTNRLMGRNGPSQRHKIKHRRKNGFEVYAVKIVKGDGLTWAVTRHGTYYSTAFLTKGKSKKP